MQRDAAVSATRYNAVAAIRSRVHSTLGTWLNDGQCIQVALACGLQSPDAVLAFFLGDSVARKAISASRVLAIRDEEWTLMYGAEAVAPNNSNRLLTKELDESGDAVTSNDMMNDAESRMANDVRQALQCTIGEERQRRLWGRDWSRCACMLSVLMTAPEFRLHTTLGSVVGSDLRRLEDLQMTFEDEADDLLTANLIERLSRLST